jgi:hypothetical protein
VREEHQTPKVLVPSPALAAMSTRPSQTTLPPQVQRSVMSASTHSHHPQKSLLVVDCHTIFFIVFSYVYILHGTRFLLILFVSVSSYHQLGKTHFRSLRVLWAECLYAYVLPLFAIGEASVTCIREAPLEFSGPLLAIGCEMEFESESCRI